MSSQLAILTGEDAHCKNLTVTIDRRRPRRQVPLLALSPPLRVVSNLPLPRPYHPTAP